MTKFITYYNLCPIPEPKDFLGISPDKEDGNVITTFSKNIIIIIKISTQKQIKSWSVLEKLSSKVVYDRKTEKYVAVFANKSIRCWDENTTDVNKCKKLKFQKSIADLVYNESETLVLYSDGTCEPLTSAINSRKNDISKHSEQLELANSLLFTNPSIHDLANGSRILTYFERNTQSGCFHLVRISLGDEKQSVKRFQLKREILDVQVAGAAVIEGEGSPILLTIWSDKRIFLLSLADEICPLGSPGHFVSMLTQLKVDSPLSIMGISKHFVAIYGANHGQEGASLLLYNTQHKVIKTKQFFKVYFNYSQLWSIDDHILLAMGQNLSVVKYRVLKEVLSELVGTQIGHDYQSAVDDHINEEEFLERCLQYSNECNVQSESKRNEKYNIEEADGLYVAFENAKYFDKELNSFKQLNLHVDVVQVDQPLDDVQISLMTNYNDNGFVCPEIQLIAKQLERAGASEHEITEKLLTVLIKANLLQDIGICLRRYNNISEKILSKTLSFLMHKIKTIEKIAIEETPAISKTTDNHMEIDLNLNDIKPLCNIDLLTEKYPKNCSSTEAIDILNILLTCSFDVDAIAVHIRQDVEYDEHILLILQHLYNLLTTSQTWFMEERPSLYPSSTDYELQLFRWFRVCITAHYQKLVFSKDIQLMELIYKWHELFESYKRVDLHKDILYNIVERKKSFKDKSSKWYSIEEVYLF